MSREPYKIEQHYNTTHDRTFNRNSGLDTEEDYKCSPCLACVHRATCQHPCLVFRKYCTTGKVQLSIVQAIAIGEHRK